MEFRSFLPPRLPFRLAARLGLLALALALAQGPLSSAATAQEAAQQGTPEAASSDATGAATPETATGGDATSGERATPPPAPVPPPPPPPPPEPEPEPMAVYIAVNGTTTGPFDRSELVTMANSGELTEASMVWQAGMADWQPASAVEAVAELIATARAAPEPAAEEPGSSVAAEPATQPEPKPVPGWGPKSAPAEAAGSEPAGQPAESPAESPDEKPVDGGDGATTPRAPEGTAAEPSGFDPARFVLGSWQSEAAELPVPDLGTTGSFTGTATYQADGAMRLEGVLRVTVNGVPLSISMNGQGSYTVVQASEGESFTITPDAQMTLTVPGYPPQVEPMTDPATYLVVDPDTMRDTEGVTWRRR